MYEQYGVQVLVGYVIKNKACAESLAERTVVFMLLGYSYTCAKFKVWPSPAEAKFASKFSSVELHAKCKWFPEFCACVTLTVTGSSKSRSSLSAQVNSPAHQFHEPAREEQTKHNQTGQWLYFIGSHTKLSFSFCYLFHCAYSVKIQDNQSKPKLPQCEKGAPS